MKISPLNSEVMAFKGEVPIRSETGIRNAIQEHEKNITSKINK